MKKIYKALAVFGLLFLPLFVMGCAKNDTWTAMYYSGGCKTCQEITITKDSFGSIEECYNHGIFLGENDKNNPNLEAVVECGKNCKKDENFQYVCSESVTKMIRELSGARADEAFADVSVQEAVVSDGAVENEGVNNSASSDGEIVPMSSYFKKGNDIFYNDKKLAGVRADDFQVLENGYAKDSRLVYHMGEPLPQFDATSFHVFAEQPQYIKDRNGVYQFGKLIEGADPDSFSVLGDTVGDIYTKDKNHVYCLDASILEGADPASFERMEPFPCSRDRSHVFYDCSMVKDANPETFRMVNYSYAADNDHVWKLTHDEAAQRYYLVEVESADPDTFDYKK